MPSEPPPGERTGRPPSTPSSAHPPPAPPTPPGEPGHREQETFATPRRLHPASVLLGIPVAQTLQALVFPAAATFAAGGLFTIGFVLIAAVVGLIFRVLDWQRRYFSFDGEVLRVDSGVISRSHRSLDVARIQQVEIQRGPVQRVLGLASLRIETAGNAAEPEVDLRVLPEQDAVALRAAVRASKARLAGRGRSEDSGSAPDAGQRVLTVPIKHVVLSSVTGARLLVLPAVIGGAFQFVGQQMDAILDGTVGLLTEQGTDIVERPDWVLIALSALAVLALAALAAIAVGIIRDGNFRIDRIDDDLHVSRGLVSTKESVVPLRRIQLVEIQRNWLRRLLGYAVVRVRSAGGSTGGDGRLTVPLLAEADVDRLLRSILPNVPGTPQLTSHPQQALRRGLFRWLRLPVLLVVVVFAAPRLVDALDVAVVGWVGYAALALVPVAALLAVVEYRHLAHGLTELVVASRRGALSITTTIAPLVKAQAIGSRRNPFQRRLGLTTLTTRVAGPSAEVEILDAGHEDAARLHATLTAHAASPIPLLTGAADPDDRSGTDGPSGTDGAGNAHETGDTHGTDASDPAQR